jgi:signal peptidase I
MSSCDNSNIRQNYIVTSTNEFDTLTACTGVWTSNINSCTSSLNINSPLNLNVISNNNSLDRILVIDGSTGLVQYRNVNTILSGASGVIDFEYDDKNTFIITRGDNVEFSATINTVTGFTINGDLLITGNTETGGDILPTNDSISNIGSQLKRFRDINTISGTSTVWTSTIKVITPTLDLGLDSNNESRVINANNSIIQNDVLIGGSF